MDELANNPDFEESYDHSPKPKDRLKRGAFLLPNLATSAGLMLGFLSICKTFDGEFVRAAWLIVAAGVFDGLDGKIARWTKTTSEFGIQYDSLADLVSFGVAPGILIYNFALRHSYAPGLGWAIALLFTICGALRLARFNVQTATIDGKWFVGMPIPGGAGILTSTVLFLNEMGWVTQAGTASSPNLVTILTLICAFMMVSTVPYWAMKDVELMRKHAFSTLFLAIICLAILIREPQRALFFIGQTYLIAGPVIWFFQKRSSNRPAVKEV